MTSRFVDLVIACHDPSRPIERAVGSVLASDTARENVRVTVVAHGQPAEAFQQRLAGIDGDWRVIEHHDGIASPAGPYNCGLALAEAEYCAVMGSDDFLEPGAIEAWMAAARSGRADMVVAPIRIDGQPMMFNPLPRPRRTTSLDAARDRLFYRSAPLGLVRTDTMRSLGLSMTEGVPVGEDIEFGVRLFAEATRIDFPFRAPCYVIGTDARERTSHTPLTIEQTMRPLHRLLDGDVPARLSPAHRRALAVKFIRISVLGAARSRPRPEDWRPGDAQALADLLDRLLALDARALHPLSRQERTLIDAIRSSTTSEGIVAGIAASDAQKSRTQRLLPRRASATLDRESILRRYMVYAIRQRRWG
ncbi:glycosyltransferase family 2 protein [Microbacterium sp. NPDC056234]|uniref:glycosyltransferase family 2 protein n=1 Tax=Microbacterium sp. NPDC056234 TaxID=3345757 RepID=UPI0035D97BB3